MIKLGRQVRMSAPTGDVFITPAVHSHSDSRVAFFTLGANGKHIMPFIVGQEFLDADDFSDRLEDVSVELANIRHLR